MEASYLKRHPFLKDTIGIICFVVCIVVGTIFINSFVFRSFSVVGQSMEKTMYTGDRIIVNRLPVTWSQLKNIPYLPERGQIIVFKNPKYSAGADEEFIVKRVIAFEGERVILSDGKYTVINDEYPNGFNPDDNNNNEPGSPTSGKTDTVVPHGEIFVSGDHRQDNYSFDSRNGLGTIPIYDVVGPVGFRLFPFDKMRSF